MTITRTNNPSIPAPLGPYVHAVRHNDTLYLSGLTAHGTDAQFGSMTAQIKEIFGRIKTLAEAEGSSLDRLLKVTAFVTDMDDVGTLRDTLFEIYGGNLPASSLVQVAGLFDHGLRIEVETILAVGE